MDEPGMPPTLLENGMDPVLFPKLFQFADELDRKAMLLGDRLGMGPDTIPERFSKLGIIEDADPLKMQKRRHPSGITESWQRALDDDTVETGKHSTNFIVISFQQ
jgi:hypothetical protein